MGTKSERERGPMFSRKKQNNKKQLSPNGLVSLDYVYQKEEHFFALLSGFLLSR